jgi:GT2 family glycosyltransferase/F0F1-type ATP synthase membrane subunit b/b'
MSAWIEHAPFAFWLCDALRPKRFVELGSHYGYSYFAFCQGLQQLGTPTTAYAIDTWQGDEHASFYDESVFNLVSHHNKSNFSSFSTLLRTTFDQAVSYFEDGSIDLLHIDGRHFYKDVREDYLSWLPKLSENAVVLFHDTNVRERDFGVWKFFRELVQQHPAFEFHHGNGLGLIVPGEEVPPALHPLLNASPEDAAQIRAIYASLGQAISVRRALIAKTEALRAMLNYGADLSLDHAETLGQLADGDYQIQEVLGGMLHAAAGSTELRRALSETQQNIEALKSQSRQEIEQARKAVEAIEAQSRQETEQARKALEAIEAQNRRETEQARKALEAAGTQSRQELRNRAAELIAEQKRHNQQAMTLTRQTAELAALRIEIAALRQSNDGLAGRLACIYASTSWRMLSPLQRALTRSPLLRTGARRTAKLLWWTATGQIVSRMRARKSLFQPPSAVLTTSDDTMATSIETVFGQSGISEVARAINLDYSLSLPLHYVSNEVEAPGGVVAVVLHMFYPELAVEFRSYLQNIPGRVDVFLSVPHDFAYQQARCAFEAWEKGSVEVRVMPNRGRDIAPKLVGFRDVYDRYETVLHLHSKQSNHATVLHRWRHHILENLLGTPETIRSIFAIFNHHPQLGMVAAAHFEPVRHWVNWGNNLEAATALCNRMGISINPAGVLDFPSGSMFWARSAALRPLLDLRLGFDDFPVEKGQTDATLAHTVERLYFLACEKAGFDWIKIAQPDLFSLTPNIIRTRSTNELAQYFAQHAFHLLSPGGLQPRTMPPAPVPAPAPGLLDQVRKHTLGQNHVIKPGTRVAIGIVTYNNDPDGLKLGVSAAIQSLRQASLPLDGSVLILDNGEDSAEALPAGDQVRRLPSVGNVGFGAGHNRLMAEAFVRGAEIYVAVNPDGILHPDAIGALVRMMQMHANRILVEALQFPMEHPKPYDPETLDTPWLSGACLAISRDVYQVLGGFDDSFFMYCEDVDLSWRARANGFALKTCPTALFLHAVTNRPIRKETLRMIFESGVILARKWGSLSFEEWSRTELQSLGAPLPAVTPMSVPDEWRRYANFDYQFSFAEPRW